MKKIIIPILIFLFSLTFISCKKNDILITGPEEVALDCQIVLECNYQGNSVIKWSSSDEATALILETYENRFAVIKGVALGTVTIEASVDGKKIEKKITVRESEIVIEGTNILFTNSKFTFKANHEVNWLTSDNDVISINSNGVASCNKEGEAYIIASNGIEEAKLLVKVYDSNFSFKISSSDTIIQGERAKINVEKTIDLDGPITYLVSDENVVKVENDEIVALNEGFATIEATFYGKTSSINVEVISDPSKIRISGENVCRLDQTIYLTCNYDCIWSSSDNNIAEVFEDGEIAPFDIGKCIICAIDKNNPNNKAYFELEIIGKTPRRISIEDREYIGLNQTTKLNITPFPSNSSTRYIVETNNPFIASVDKYGNVTGLNEGEVLITVYSFEDKSVYASILLKVTKPAPLSIKVTGENQMVQGAHNYLDLEFEGDDVSNDVEWYSSDNKIAIVYDGIVLGVNKGEAKITAKSTLDEKIFGEITISVIGYNAPTEDSEDIKRVKAIMDNMTIEQKIGQMFVVGFNGTEMTSDLIKAIENYHFGNVIYMGYNVTDPETLGNMSDSIQNKMLKENGVGAFISTDQEGGTVARIKVGGTHFVSNMAIGATGDYNNSFLEGKGCGEELRHYGINVDFAPVIDVNNNPDNPIIGVRSYSDNPLIVSLYGKNMYLGLRESNVMGCAKHFPGHGNTSTDSHYGLPTITTNMNELYQTELAPYIASIANGIDAIMTTHIIFTAIDEVYPATLSKKVLTDLLRNELGYNGLIITDGMEMGAVTNNFGGYDVTGLKAILAGADILTYTTTANPIRAYNGILNAYKKGELTEERINESVERILLKKLKYGILDNPYSEKDDISDLLVNNEELNNKFAEESLTLIRGEFEGLDKDKKTLIISPTTSNDLGSGLEVSSFACFASKYLNDLGYDTEYMTASLNITSNERSVALKIIDNFDQIVLAFSNVKKSNYKNTVNFVKEIAALNKEVIVIGLDSPYDLMLYGDSVKTYLNAYNYQKATVIALSKWLSGEIEAKGTSSVSMKNFK